MKLIRIALKYCKKVVCVLLIILMLVTPGKVFADNGYRIDTNTKESLLQQAQVVDWKEFDKVMYMGSRFIVVDYKTGVFWIAERHMGGSHADIECVDKQSTENRNLVKHDDNNWKTRPVLIVFEDGRVYCASSFVVDHAGVDDEPFLKVIDKRSHGYGRGENYDKIKGNNQSGHNCVHVRGSKNHYNNKVSEAHQKNIDTLIKERSRLR